MYLVPTSGRNYLIILPPVSGSSKKSGIFRCFDMKNKVWHCQNNTDIIHGLCDVKYNCYLGGAIIIYSKRVGIRRIKNLVYLRYNKFFHYSIRSEFKKWSVWKWSEQNSEQLIPSLKFWNREMDRSGEEKRMLVNKTIYFSAPMWLKNCIRWWVENQCLLITVLA